MPYRSLLFPVIPYRSLRFRERKTSACNELRTSVDFCADEKTGCRGRTKGQGRDPRGRERARSSPPGGSRSQRCRIVTCWRVTILRALRGAHTPLGSAAAGFTGQDVFGERESMNYTCTCCGGAKTGSGTRKEGSFRLPSKWKQPHGNVTCSRCWKAAYVLRAVALPVVAVLEGGTEEEFRAAILDGFRLSTDVNNWATRHLLAHDFVRTPETLKIPEMPKVDLYRAYNDAGCPCGDLASQSRTALFRAAQSHYVRHRHESLWLGQESLPLKRFPAPFPVHNQGWKAATLQDRPAISFRLHGAETGPRWTVRLASGAPFRRQLRQFAQIVSGEAIAGQLDLYTQGCGQTDRNGMYLVWRRTSGGQRRPERLMAKLVAYFPREPKREADEAMLLRTHPASFWVAEIDGRVERPWLLNGDHLARSMAMMRDNRARHEQWLQRIGEDRKHEKRWPIHQRRQFQDAYLKRCEKHHRRVKTWIDQMVAQVVQFAQRRRVGTIAYLDDDRRFALAFPWHQAEVTLHQRCDQAGIRVIDASAEVTKRVREELGLEPQGGQPIMATANDQAARGTEDQS